MTVILALVQLVAVAQPDIYQPLFKEDIPSLRLLVILLLTNELL